MTPLERLTSRTAIRTGLIALGAMICLALSSTPAAADHDDPAITHGWPGSIFEQIKLIGPPTDPAKYGGRAEVAFDVLMKRLGYTRYVAQGGDWGAGVVQAMARQAPSGLAGIHTNLPAVVPFDVGAALGGGPAPADFTPYWLTNTAASSARIYWENRGRDLTGAGAHKTDEISVPVAITVFPDEVFRAQERWARRAFPTLTCFNRTERGGHFAMWEHPQLFAAELRAAFHSVRGAQ